MGKYIIATDSCVDLPSGLAEELNIKVIPLSVHIGDYVYFNYLDEREIKFKSFYDILRRNIKTSTSMVNPEDFIDFFRKYLEQGYDILSISFSSALSGTYNSSRIAAEELLEEYPERKIYTIDSLAASMGEGLLLTYAANLKQQGKTIEEVRDYVEAEKTSVCHLFTVGDLNHLRRGGRLSYGKALLGTLLKVKPLLHVNLEGKLVQTGTTRGRKQALNKLIERMAATIKKPEEQIIYISHGDSEDEANELKQEIIKRLKVKDVLINYIGPVIGSHSGLGTIAIFYLGNDRYLPYK